MIDKIKKMLLKDKAVPWYFVALTGILVVIYYPTFFNAPRSDWWESLYFFHTIYASHAPHQWLDILNTDCLKHVSFRPLSHWVLYFQHLIFGANFFYVHLINFSLYCLSLVLLYKFAGLFVSNKRLVATSIGFFALLYSHFDIVSWTAHSYFILGFCLFLLGFIIYAKFLKTGNAASLFFAVILFLSGMFCYEAFIFWPLSIAILTQVESLINRDKFTKNRLRLTCLLAIGLVYATYISVFFLTRNIQTYADSGLQTQALILEFASVTRIYRTALAVFFSIFYNGFLVNIMPMLAYPAWVAPTSFNLQLGGFLREYRPTILDMQIASAALLFIGAGVFGYLIRHKKFNILKILLLFVFLLVSFDLTVFISKYFSNKVYSYCFYQFRYQYTPNAFIVLFFLVFFDQLMKMKQKVKIIIYVVAAIIVLSNIYCTVSAISLEARQLGPLNRMLANIKKGIKSGQVNEKNKLYLDNHIVNVLPQMCWNPVIGKFMQGTYQWLFNRKEIKYFSNTPGGAVWSIDPESLNLARGSFKAVSEETQKSTPEDETPAIDSIQFGEYMDLGNFYNNRGKAKEAEQVFLKALEVNSDSNQVHIYLGELYRKQGRYLEAEKMFRRAVEINPENVDGYSALGGLYQLQGNYSEAERVLKKALEINPENFGGCLSLGNLYDTVGNLKEAQRYFIKALELNSYSTEAYHALAGLYNQQGDYQKAEEMLKKLLVLNPHSAEDYNSLAGLYNQQGDYQKAEEMFKKVLEINPNNNNVCSDLGHLYNSQNRHLESEEMFKRALRINPNNASACNGLGSLYANQGKYPEAEEMYKKALKLSSRSDIFYADLGHFYSNQNRYPEAEEMFSKALKINPENSGASNALENCYKQQGKK
jgi:tetratricopeptide (TPR) repeat protein